MQQLMQRIPAIVLALFCCAVPVSSLAAPNIIFFHGDTYAAIAYSEETGRYGYKYDAPTRDIAETLARRYCQAKDAKVVVWVHNGFCALARGEQGAWGVGWSDGDGASDNAAKKTALAECGKRGKHPRLVLCVCSLNRKPEEFE